MLRKPVKSKKPQRQALAGFFLATASSGKATIDEQIGAGHEARFRAGQVSHHACHFIGVAMPGQRHQAVHQGGKVAFGRVHVGIDRAGRDIVDGDSRLPRSRARPLTSPVKADLLMA